MMEMTTSSSTRVKALKFTICDPGFAEASLRFAIEAEDIVALCRSIRNPQLAIRN
jgi:hypothetical protein